jgi:hypothetical protein
LWLTGFQTLRAMALRPMVRLGASVDLYPDISVTHQAVFNSYLLHVATDPLWRVYLGIGFQINPSWGMEAR